MTRFSISVGAQAYPQVKEAIEHAEQNPTHDPFVVCYLDNEGQHVSWTCYRCLTSDWTADASS